MTKYHSEETANRVSCDLTMHLIQQLGLQRCEKSIDQLEKWHAFCHQIAYQQFEQDYPEACQRELLKFGEHPTARDREKACAKNDCPSRLGSFP